MALETCIFLLKMHDLKKIITDNKPIYGIESVRFYDFIVWLTPYTSFRPKNLVLHPTMAGGKLTVEEFVTNIKNM